MKTFSFGNVLGEAITPIDRSNQCELCFEKLPHDIFPASDSTHNYCSKCQETVPSATIKQGKVVRNPRDSAKDSISLNQKDIRSFLTKCSQEYQISPRLNTSTSTSGMTPTKSVKRPDYKTMRSDSTMYTFEDDQDLDEYQLCNLCNQENESQTLYTNPYCQHNFCLICVAEFMSSHPGLEECYLEECCSPLDESKIDHFRLKCTLRQTTQIRTLQNLATKNSIRLPKKVLKLADSYIDMGSQAKNPFFMIGLLLIEDRLGQKSVTSFDADQKILADMFTCLELDDYIQKFKLVRIQDKLKELFSDLKNFISKILKDHEETTFHQNIKPVITDFVLSECQKDQKKEQALKYLGRFALADNLIKKKYRNTTLYKKLAEFEWEANEYDEQEILEVFSYLYNFNLKFFIVTDNDYKETSYGKEDAASQVILFEILNKKNFRALFYNSI